MSEEELKAIELLKEDISYRESDLAEYNETKYSNAERIIIALVNKQQKEIEELKERLSIRKEQQKTILVEKIKTLREEKIELIHDIEEREKILKKEIKSLLKEIERLNSIINTDDIINKERAELIEQQRKEIEYIKDIKKEHKIMRRIIKENGLWEILLKDDEFSKYLLEE